MAHGPELVVLGVRGLGPDLRLDDSEPMPSDAVFVHGMWPGDSGAGQMTRTVLIVESLIRPMCSGERPDRWVDGPSRRWACSRRARGQLAVMVAVHRSAGFRPRGARGSDRNGAPAGVAVLSLNHKDELRRTTGERVGVGRPRPTGRAGRAVATPLSGSAARRRQPPPRRRGSTSPVTAGSVGSPWCCRRRQC